MPDFWSGSDYYATKNGSYEFARWGDYFKDRHVASNFTAYDDAIRQVWIFGMSWGYANQTGIEYGDSAPNVSLTCLRANVLPGNRQLADGKKTEDANTPGTTGQPSAAVSFRVDSSVLLVAAVSAFATGFLL
ncbi:hypothetical protein B0T25DRAFT_517855 [Lasiosphaeria hispida]|uniref:Uncharacterized protein n=1 Tax=Lasiosphaeria hispida TaxID=260671 RepID=A0AAJ0MDM5_9PEZI|nr:hypothetical protein B0T25DRAFT_517855 [Lasiosphaeria hispida]